MASRLLEKHGVGTRNEKADDLISSITSDVQRLRQDVEKNAAILTRYETSIQNGNPESFRESTYQSASQVFLSSITKAPVNVLRKASARLRRLVRKILLVWRDTSRYLPRLLVGDHIRLEDALGRHMRLPFHKFKHEQTLRQYITHIFNGVPGGYQVDRGRFRLDLKYRRRGTKRCSAHRQLRPGDHVLMSIVSVVPSEAANLSTQQRCLSCGTQVAVEPSASNFHCQQCDRMYSIELAPPRRHVRPSDGDCNKKTMLAQKEVIRKVLGHVQCGSRGVHDGSRVEGGLRPATPTDVNLGLSLVRNVVVVETHEPSGVLDAVEELLHQVGSQSQVKGDDGSGPSLQLQHPLKVLNVLRSEVERGTDEINMFDFEKEHVEFMRIAREVMSSLHDGLDASGDGHDRTRKATECFNQLAKWTKKRFPQATAEAVHPSPYPWTTSPTNPQSRPDQKIDANETGETALLMLSSLTQNFSILRVRPDFTVQELKRAIQDRDGVPIEQQYLVTKGRKMGDHQTVGQCGLTGPPKWYVHMLLPIWK